MKQVREVRLKFAFSLASCLTAACLMASACAGRGDSSPVIATVNGRDIHRAQFERFLALKIGEFTTGDTPDSLRGQMLDEYIIRRLVLDEAARAGVGVTDADVEQAAEENPRMKSAAAGTREELVDDLVVKKYYRQVVLGDVRVPLEEIQQYIEANEGRLTDKPGFFVREIRAQSREEAERLRREVVEAKTDFATVARLHSDAPNSDAGGLARYDEGQLPPVLEKAIHPLRPGEVTPVIQSSFGYHIFKLERRLTAAPADDRRSQLDERRAQLVEELIARRNQQAVDEALDRLNRSARVTINDSALGFTYAGRFRHN